MLSKQLKMVTLLNMIKYSSYPPDTNIIDFIDVFLAADKALMISSGMNKKITNFLFNDIKKLKKSLKSNNLSDKKYLINRINEIKENACSQKKNPSYISSQILLTKSLYIIGGASIVTINDNAVNIIGVSFSEFSSAYGVYLINKGLQ